MKMLLKKTSLPVEVIPVSTDNGVMYRDIDTGCLYAWNEFDVKGSTDPVRYAAQSTNTSTTSVVACPVNVPVNVSGSIRTKYR